ncbi:MAG: hypothetical protein HND56_07215 [Pseudomonadota bacterium]|nr:hypothetical protein [Pseudomonadota bacterium]QKK05484.1 MAG: hypothetical protein HND56_07215 [Pseudomonadota bacterium]
MTPINFFKLQAKNLFKDYKTQTPYIDEVNGRSYYKYTPQYFDIERISLKYDWDEENFSLMKAQHLFALMLGFDKWTHLVKASDVELELTKLLWDNQHKISLEDWQMYIANVEFDNSITLSTTDEIEILKQVFINVDGHHNPFGDYRLKKNRHRVAETPQQTPTISTAPQITSLPLDQANRAEFIEAANRVFEAVIWRMEPNNPEQTRKLWNAENYIDNLLLTDDMLPISKDYALSLIDAFLVHHVLDLAVQADKMAA